MSDPFILPANNGDFIPFENSEEACQLNTDRVVGFLRKGWVTEDCNKLLARSRLPVTWNNQDCQLQHIERTSDGTFQFHLHYATLPIAKRHLDSQKIITQACYTEERWESYRKNIDIIGYSRRAQSQMDVTAQPLDWSLHVISLDNNIGLVQSEFQRYNEEGFKPLPVVLFENGELFAIEQKYIGASIHRTLQDSFARDLHRELEYNQPHPTVLVTVHEIQQLARAHRDVCYVRGKLPIHYTEATKAWNIRQLPWECRKKVSLLLHYDNLQHLLHLHLPYKFGMELVVYASSTPQMPGHWCTVIVDTTQWVNDKNDKEDGKMDDVDDDFVMVEKISKISLS